jgi:hypothetical protein
MICHVTGLASSGSQELQSGESAALVYILEAIALVLWESLLVFFFMLFSPPMGGANESLGLPSSVLAGFSALTSLFFHSLALPLAAVLVLVTLIVFGAKGRRSRLIGYAVTAGALISSGTMVLILITGGGLLAYGGMVLGIVLEAGGVVALFISLWPRRDPSAPMRLLGFDLARLTMWVVIAAALFSVAAGSYAALGNAQWSPTPLLGQLPAEEEAHSSLVIAFIDAAIVVLVAKWFAADRYGGAPGLLAKTGLYGVLIGTLFAAAAVPAALAFTLIAGELTILGSGPMLASVFIICAVAVGEARRFHLKVPIWLVKEPLTFGLLFLLYWVNMAVMLPSIYLGSHYARFTSQYFAVYYLDAFTVGHEHALVTLTAILLFILLALTLGVRGKIGALAGLALIAGSVVSSVANVFYIFDLIPNGYVYIEYIGDGIALIVIGVMVAFLGMIASSAKRVLPLWAPSARDK